MLAVYYNVSQIRNTLLFKTRKLISNFPSNSYKTSQTQNKIIKKKVSFLNQSLPSKKGNSQSGLP